MAEPADDMLKQHVLATRHLIVTKDLGKSESFWRNSFIGSRCELKLREIQERERKANVLYFSIDIDDWRGDMYDWYESDQLAKTDEPTCAKQEVKERQDTRILAKRGVEVKDTESQDWLPLQSGRWKRKKERGKTSLKIWWRIIGEMSGAARRSLPNARWKKERDKTSLKIRKGSIGEMSGAARRSLPNVRWKTERRNTSQPWQEGRWRNGTGKTSLKMYDIRLDLRDVHHGQCSSDAFWAKKKLKTTTIAKTTKRIERELCSKSSDYKLKRSSNHVSIKQGWKWRLAGWSFSLPWW